MLEIKQYDIDNDELIGFRQSYPYEAFPVLGELASSPNVERVRMAKGSGERDAADREHLTDCCPCFNVRWKMQRTSLLTICRDFVSAFFNTEWIDVLSSDSI